MHANSITHSFLNLKWRFKYGSHHVRGAYEEVCGFFARCGLFLIFPCCFVFPYVACLHKSSGPLTVLFCKVRGKSFHSGFNRRTGQCAAWFGTRARTTQTTLWGFYQISFLRQRPAGVMDNFTDVHNKGGSGFREGWSVEQCCALGG